MHTKNTLKEKKKEKSFLFFNTPKAKSFCSSLRLLVTKIQWLHYFLVEHFASMNDDKGNEEAVLSDVDWKRYTINPKQMGVETIFEVEADNFWSQDLDRLCKVTRYPVVSPKENTEPHEDFYSVCGAVVRCINAGCPVEDKYAIHLGDEYWLIPRKTDYVDGTAVLKLEGNVFLLEKRSTVQNKTNCELFIDLLQKKVVLRINSPVRSGSSLILYLRHPNRTAMDSITYDWLKNMVYLLLELEEESWIEDSPPNLDYDRSLMTEFFSKVKTFRGCVAFTKEREISANDNVRHLHEMLRTCIAFMLSAWPAPKKPDDRKEYPIFPLNHLLFTGVAEQFRYVEGESYLHDKNKIRYIDDYCRRQADMRSKNRFFVPARVDDDFWRNLGDDGEYLCPLNA
jgi:hypothetical protein